MKKLILTITLLIMTVAYAQAQEKILADVVSIEYDSTILEVENNIFKAKDSITIHPAGDTNGTVTKINENIITVAINNNGFAVGSKITVNNANSLGKANSKNAVVKSTKVNSIVLDVKDNNFKVNDKIVLQAIGDKKATVKSVQDNIITISTNNIGYAENSKVLIEKGKEGFKGKRNNK